MDERIRLAEGMVPGLVSVITPCFNAEAHLAATIESVAAQDYAPIEHLVVDDASTDGGWAVIERYGAAVTGIRLDRNGGASRARNAGVAAARGEFLLFLDADDLISADTVGAMVETSRANPGEIVHCDWRRLRLERGEWVIAAPDVPLPDRSVDPLTSWLAGRWVPPCSVLWPRGIYHRLDGWDEEIGFNDDADLMMRALAEGIRMVHSPGGEAYYRAPAPGLASLSHAIFTEERCRSNLRVHEKLAVRLEELGRLDEFADPLGFIFRDQASRAFLEGYPELGRKSVELGLRYGSEERMARTRSGHLLARLFGVEGKERIAGMLARAGIMTPARRRVEEARRALKAGSAADEALR